MPIFKCGDIGIYSVNYFKIFVNANYSKLHNIDYVHTAGAGLRC